MIQQKYNLVIADTSCLILLSKINELSLLHKVFNKAYITKDILSEFGGPLPSWLIIKTPKNKNLQNVLELKIDKGEASAISLYFEISNSIIILDE
jgi:predicted nucleic acid-binding protein